jgi:opacity protein-like surface antigen
MKRLLTIVAASAALGACQTATVYQPASARAAVGYTEQRIEPGRYRVTFQGGGGAPAAQVSDYALLRAAEITLREGYDWFRVTDRYGSASGYSGSRVSVGTGGGSFGRRSAFGLGIGTSFDLSGGPALAETLEVLMGRGPKPAGVDSYDASAVIASVGPRAHPPAPPA